MRDFHNRILLQSTFSIIVFILFSIMLLSSNLLAEESEDILELDIYECIKIALENSIDLREATMDVHIADAQLTEASSGLYPSFSLLSTYSRRHPASSVDFPGGNIAFDIIEKDQYDVTFSMEYLISDGGKISSLKSQAEANLDINELNRVRIEEEIILNTSLAYFQTLKADKLLEVAKQAVDLNQEQLDIAQSRFTAGTVAKADVLKAEAELADAQIKNIEAKNRYDLSVKLLNDALYIPLNSQIELSKDFSEIHWDITLEECLSLHKK